MVVLREVDWYQLGIQLEVPIHILKRIKRQNIRDELAMLTEMLEYWKDNKEDSSWEKIVKALQRIGGHRSIITKIRSKYMSHEFSSSAELRSSTGEGGVSHEAITPVSREEIFSIIPVNIPFSDYHFSQSVKQPFQTTWDTTERKHTATKTRNRYKANHVILVDGLM